jgi:glycosyltransferase involved in cell wall biosynthesis
VNKQENSGISVLVCCYNSAGRLPETLRHLALQEVPHDLNWEIIVINNASTDDTFMVANTEWQQYNISKVGFKVLNDEKPGKNFAFKTGMANAEYDYILTCDDDNWLSPDYIATAYSIMQADNKIGALGGFAIFEPEQPFNTELDNLTGYFVNGPQTWVESQHWVYGAGSIYKKDVVVNLFNNGWQQITSGRTGTSLICGEDVEICLAIYLSGYKVIANDELKFKHFVPLKRQTISYITNLSYWLGYSEFLLNSYFTILSNDQRNLQTVFTKWMFRLGLSLSKQRLKLFYQKLSGKPVDLKQHLALQSRFGIFNSLRKNLFKVLAHHKKLKAMLAQIAVPNPNKTYQPVS